MAETGSQTRLIQGWIDRLRAGDETARKHLLNCAVDRLTRLARKMLKGFPRVRRWEETGDVLQNASVRLYRSLEQVQPATVADFFRLAALNIRRELHDLARHYYGPQGQGAKHATLGKGPQESGHGAPSPLDKPGASDDPDEIIDWTEFHQRAEKLPDDEREVFDLLWYQGLSQAEAAQILNVSARTIKRRWQSARLHIYQALEGEPPEA
jgi:RNA polymerase sigma-70 factor (ECF subfamily)